MDSKDTKEAPTLWVLWDFPEHLFNGTPPVAASTVLKNLYIPGGGGLIHLSF